MTETLISLKERTLSVTIPMIALITWIHFGVLIGFLSMLKLTSPAWVLLLMLIILSQSLLIRVRWNLERDIDEIYAELSRKYLYKTNT